MRFLILSFFLFLVGCASFTSPARKHELESNKSYWMDYDATRRGTVVAGKDAAWKSCAEPAPDAAIGLVTKLEGSIKVPKGEASGKGELAQSIVSLAEKTQMVLFLRESLFRLCELSINSKLTSADAQTLYTHVINAALALVKKEEAEIRLKQQRLESADQAQYIYQYLHQKNVDKDVIEELLRDLP